MLQRGTADAQKFSFESRNLRNCKQPELNMKRMYKLKDSHNTETGAEKGIHSMKEMMLFCMITTDLI